MMVNSSPKTKLHLTLLIVIAMLSACGKSIPSDADARAELEKGEAGNGRISNGLKSGVIKVGSFTKTNGQSGETFGIKWYKTEYQAELTFLKNMPRDPFCAEFMEGYCGGNKEGDKKIIKGEIAFEQTEKGWKGPSGAIY